MGFKGDTTRNSIKEEAKKIFALRGFKVVTMKDICEVTNLSRGGLYRYFGSTTELFEELWCDMISGQENVFAVAMKQGENAAEVLQNVLEKRKEEMGDSQNNLSLAVYEYSHAVDSRFFENINHNSKKMWSEFLQYGINRGEIKPVDVNAVTDLILFSYQGARMWSSVIPIENVADSITDTIKKLLL